MAMLDKVTFMSLSPTSLKLFLAVMEYGTIAAAAKEHHIAAAAISKRISELEEHLNVTLLIRTNKGVKPTSAVLHYKLWLDKLYKSLIKFHYKCKTMLKEKGA